MKKSWVIVAVLVIFILLINSMFIRKIKEKKHLIPQNIPLIKIELKN